jgi:hypothetical protein
MGELIRLTEHGLARRRLAQQRRPGWHPDPGRFTHCAASPGPDDAAPDRPIDLDAARRRRRIRQEGPAVVHVRFGASAPGGPAPPDPQTACDTFHLERRPRIIGRQNGGTLLSVEPGSWVPEPERFRYRWYRDGRPIHRATGPRYRVDAADRGASLSVKVTAIRGGVSPHTATVTIR